MKEFVWIDDKPRPASQQMAIDLGMVAVSQRLGIAVLRLYQWCEPTLSLGANEAALKTWNKDKLVDQGIACVRRPTGGRGVWHSDNDLTYAWVGPSGGPKGVRDRYRDLHRRLGSAVASMGVATSLAPPPTSVADLSPGACFDLAVGGELLAGGRKLLGSAQKVVGDGLLQHGAFARIDHTTTLNAFRLNSGTTARSSQKTRIPEARELIEAIDLAWLAAGAMRAEPRLTTLLERASVQHEAHFGDPQWTWRR